MCGIAGFYNFEKFSQEKIESIARQMGDSIAHRGPDTFGFWMDKPSEISLIHRRLSILDLSSAGNQPMHSPSKRYVITYNGEVYNHLDLRKNIEKNYKSIVWKGSSDTETISCALDCWGIAEAVKKFRGMFAIAIWDKKLKTLSIARDIAGEKPLYYGWQQNVFMFSSELKAMKNHPAFLGEIDRDSIRMQMTAGCIPAPYSIYKGIFKLPPGNILTIDLSNKTSKNDPVVKCFWSLEKVFNEKGIGNFSGTYEDAVDELEALLKKSIKSQMLADVPLGAFLSGGVDSSLVVSLMQSQSIQPINTFTIGFEESKYNEANFAKDIATFLRTNHTEYYISPNEALAVIPSLPNLYDEPFSDSSQIPTYLVSKLAKKSVTVALSGDGGDELFGGYNRHIYSERWGSAIQSTNPNLKRAFKKIILSLNPEKYNFLESFFSKPYMPKIKINNFSNYIDKISKALSASDNSQLYGSFTSHWQEDEGLVLGSKNLNSMFVNRPDLSLSEEMMFNDFISYLPNDILVKVDRAAMGLSLETRVPMLDQNIIEYAWSLPESMKIGQGEGKLILKKILDKYIPSEFFNRPKQGFALPIEQWLRGPLVDWAESLINRSRLECESYFDADMVQRKWSEHKSGKRNWQTEIWNVLMFQAWLEKE